MPSRQATRDKAGGTQLPPRGLSPRWRRNTAMAPGPRNPPDGPYDPQPRPSDPEVNPVLPGHGSTEIPIREPEGVPAIDPGRSPGLGIDPAPAKPGPSEPQPRA